MLFFWMIVIVFALLLYVVLDGYDLGIGVLTLFQPDAARRRQMVEVVGNVWDGNETWILLVAMGLWGAFPDAYATALGPACSGSARSWRRSPRASCSAACCAASPSTTSASPARRGTSSGTATGCSPAWRPSPCSPWPARPCCRRRPSGRCGTRWRAWAA